MNSSAQDSKVEIVNCNHGGFYSVNDRSRDPGTHGFGHMLGQIQRMSPRKWAARKHGQYRDENPPVFATQRAAIAYLADR